MSELNNLNEASSSSIPTSSSESSISNPNTGSALHQTESKKTTILSYASVSSNKPPEPTDKDVIDSDLDACCASFKIMDENMILHSNLMYTKARVLIEYCHLYLSQFSELNGVKTDLVDRFDKYLAKLEPEDSVKWRAYMKIIDRNALRQDAEIKNFIRLLYVEKYSVLRGGIHTITIEDLELFSKSLDLSKDEEFISDKDKWKSLVQFLSKPGRIEKCEAQKKFLKNQDKI